MNALLLLGEMVARVVLEFSAAEAIPRAVRLAYLTLCRSIQLLALLARRDAAKDLELLVLRISSPCSAARFRDPSWNQPTEPCSPRSAACCPGPAGPASSSPRRRCCAGTGG